MEEKKTSEAVEEIAAEPKEVGNLAMAKVVFPFKSSHSVVAGIPKCIYLLVDPKPYLITVKSPHLPLILPKRWLLVIMFVVTI